MDYNNEHTNNDPSRCRESPVCFRCGRAGGSRVMWRHLDGDAIFEIEAKARALSLQLLRHYSHSLPSYYLGRLDRSNSLPLSFLSRLCFIFMRGARAASTIMRGHIEKLSHNCEIYQKPAILIW